MNAAQLLAHFDRISDAPDAISRLRVFILDLAVWGKLAQQDATDEPAGTLLERIHTEMARLVKHGKPKRLGSLRQRSHPDLPDDVPPGWAVASLQDICTSVTDGDHIPPPKADRGIPFLVIGNVRGKQVDFVGCRHVPDDYYNALDPTRRPQKGDILYTLVGSYGIPILVTDSRPFCVQRHIGILRPSRTIDVRFLARILESRFIFEQASRCATGIAQKTVPLAGLRRMRIPVPPVSEQHRIVAKVDELMSLCDRLESSRAERESRRDRLAAASLHRLNQSLDTDAPEPFREHARFYLNHLSRLTTRTAHVKQLRQTILNLAVRGRLVPQDANDGSAAELLRSIKARKKLLIDQGTLRNAKACRRPDDIEIPHDIPACWLWTILGEITDVGTGSTPSRAQPSFWTGGSVPWISSGSTSQKLITAGDEFVTQTAVSAHRLRLYRPGTLLVALYGQGRTRGQVATLGIEATINQACAAVCPVPGFESLQAYLRLLLKKTRQKKSWVDSGSGSLPSE